MPTGEEESSKIDSKPKSIEEEEEEDDEEDEQIYFTPYCQDSYKAQLENEKKAKEKAEANLKNQGEAHLVDGELRFESEEDHGPAKKRNPDLVEGNTLPEDSGMPKELYGKPLEEIDKLITDKTFVVIGPRFKREYIYRFSSSPSFFLFKPWNKLRLATVYIATSQFFDYFIILTILTNCVFLAMPDEPASNLAEENRVDPDQAALTRAARSGSALFAKVLKGVCMRYVFLAIYTIEMIIKLIARGFFIYSYTYLRDAWNWLDFIVILSAYLTIVLENSLGSSSLGNLQGIRTFRVFRVLRTVSIVPGLKTIVNALLRAFRLLLEVMMLILFCLMVFALFGLQIFMGVLRQKCVATVPAYNGTPSYTYAQYYNDFIKNSSNWVMDEDDYLVCGNVSFTRACPSGYTCLKDVGENPRFGYVGFDHFGWSMLTSFQLITLDFWEDTYNKILSSVGPWTVIFFVFVVFFGSFYLVNLMLAVVAMSYEEEAETAGKRRQRMSKLSKPSSAPPITSKPSKINNSELEKEKEDKNKKKRKKKKQKAERDALKDLANTTTAAVAAAAEMALHPSKHIHEHDTHDESGPISALGTPARKHIQRKPMVKMPSKDSGTGNSVESSRSNGSKDEDYLIHGDEASFGSSVLDKGFKKDVNKPMPFRKPLVKQESTGIASMVSASGVALSHDKGSQDQVDQVGKYQTIKEWDDRKNVGTTGEEGRDYIAEKYPDLIIIDVEDNFEQTPKDNELVNRNCNCCYNCCKGRLFVPWLKVQAVFFSIAMEPLFDLFITICIVLNTVMMATEYHGMPEELKETQRISNYIFTAVFTLEAVIKITAFGKHYFKIGWNVFDLVIVVASVVDLGLEDIQGLSVFRTFRLLRVFKLAQSWPTMRLLLSIIVNTLGALGNLTLILCIIIYIFAVIGLQLFNKSYTEDKFSPDPVPRWHFKDIFHSFMMVFRVLCGEWIEPLWDCMRAADELCMAVFLPTLILGNFIVLNLFLALLLNAFASDSLRKAKEDSEDNKLKLAFKRLYDLCCGCCPCFKKPVNAVDPNDGGEIVLLEEMDGKNDNAVTDGKQEKKQPNGLMIKPADSHTDIPFIDEDTKNMDKTFNTSTKRDQFSNFNKSMDANKSNNAKVGPAPIIEVEKAQDDTDARPGVRIVRIPSTRSQRSKKEDSPDKEVKKDHDDLELGDEASTIKKDDDEEEEDEDTKIEVVDCFPLCCTNRCQCFSGSNMDALNEKWFNVRVFMNRVVEHRVFEGIILFLIAASSISLACEDVHLYASQGLKDALFWLNIIFAVLFTVEMLMKWLAYGFRKYFTSFWTLLDFCIVVVSLASIIADAQGAGNFSAFRALRTLRAFRPLRAISRWQGMKIVVNALMMAIPAIINVLVVCIVFWLIFSIMGVQFFAGKFFKCVDADGETLLPSVVKYKADCIANNYTWKNSPVTFDNVGAGYLALFQVATFEGWMEVMIDAIDSTSVDEQPSFENNLYYYLYFVGFIIFGSFFTLNLFIGVIIDNFNVLKKKYDGSYLDMFLTPGQRQYYNTLKKLGNKKPRKTIKRPKNKIQGVLYDVSISTKFELCIVITIMLNMIVMAVEHYNQTDTVTDVLKILNIVFTVIFALEAMLKIGGLRLHYFRIGWNVFDFIVVVLSLLEIILEDILADLLLNPTLFRVIRVFRIGRVLRLIKAAKGIRKLLFALVISLPALFNIGLLLFLIMYIYTIICLSSFQNLKITGALDDNVVNFKTFLNSFMLLFRLATSAGWNDILEPMLIESPDCDSNCYIRPDGQQVCDGSGDCGTPWLAVLILTSYILIIFLVVINMFIAVILENFNQAHEQEEVGITEDDFDMFYAVWERYDPLATQFIKYEQLSNFVSDLEPPLGIPKPNEIALVSFDLPIVEGDKLHCLDVLMALVKYVLGTVEESPEFKQLHEQMELRFQEAFPTRVNTNRKSTTMMRKKEDVAAKTLQRAWRSWKAQKQLKNITALAVQQSQHKKAAVESRTKTSSIRSLGQRLSTALSQFFSSSRPSSAISRLSVQSPTASTSALDRKSKPKKTAKVQSALEVPKVSILYSPDQDRDVEL